MSSPSSALNAFIQKCLSGEATLDQIDDYIDEWHDSQSNETLASFLGMTEAEYALWVKNPGALQSIVNSHKRRPDEDRRRRVSTFR